MARPDLALEVSPAERARLEACVRRTTTPQALAKRVRMILLLADGLGTAAVARRLDCGISTVNKWSVRWRQRPCLEGLWDAPRSGRPAQISLETRCEIVALACSRPEGDTAPFREVWTQQALADALLARTGVEVSRSSVQRVLSARGLRPHRVRPWLHSPDPDFKPKARRICELYLEPPDDAIVVCIDEKPMQVLSRRYPTRTGRDATVRYEFEYSRHGTRALLGVFEVRTGQVIGQVVEHRDAETLVQFLESIAARYPERRIIVIWDNLNIHTDGKDARWSKFNARHEGRFEFVYTPVHASWLNQIEIWFSILQRRVLRYGSFDNARELEAAVVGFIDYWNRYEAHPFRWKFSGNFIQTPCRIDAGARPEPHAEDLRYRSRRVRGRALAAATRAPQPHPRPQARRPADPGVGPRKRQRPACPPSPRRTPSLDARNATPLPLATHAVLRTREGGAPRPPP
jgi:transposase